ncbi:hypothetical protein L208DRAFT_1412414 [Tricholoma matsutake]|nr:hypothetical protein L208DRAFT_1412414 [Tricholoma matsutake 945]
MGVSSQDTQKLTFTRLEVPIQAPTSLREKGEPSTGANRQRRVRTIPLVHVVR